MARRATSLGPKPSLFVFLFLFCFCFFVFFGVFFLLGGFKGQVRWPEGPPHLALNPPYLFVFFFFLVAFCFLFGSFPFFALIEKPVFPPKRGIFWFIFSVSLSSSLNLFWPPPFLFLFLCLSFPLFFSFFLLVFLLWLSFCFLLLSLFSLFFLLCFCFMNRTA